MLNPISGLNLLVFLPMHAKNRKITPLKQLQTLKGSPGGNAASWKEEWIHSDLFELPDPQCVETRVWQVFTRWGGISRGNDDFRAWPTWKCIFFPPQTSSKLWKRCRWSGWAWFCYSKFCHCLNFFESFPCALRLVIFKRLGYINKYNSKFMHMVY